MPSTDFLRSTAVIIPALNEAPNLQMLLPALARMAVGQIVVGDNGSDDGSGEVAARCGAVVAHEPRRGYGAACHAALQCVDDDIEVIAFLDADLADDHTMLPQLVEPIIRGERDFMIGVRVRRLRAAGSMTLPQVFGNWLATRLIRWGWGHRYRDLGPFRAIRRRSLDAIGMQDRAFGWTVEMQIRAVEEHLGTGEIDVPYARREGTSKISGTVKGVCLAGYWILTTCARLYVTKSRRTQVPD